MANRFILTYQFYIKRCQEKLWQMSRSKNQKKQLWQTLLLQWYLEKPNILKKIYNFKCVCLLFKYKRLLCLIFQQLKFKINSQRAVFLLKGFAFFWITIGLGIRTCYKRTIVFSNAVCSKQFAIQKFKSDCILEHSLQLKI